MAGKRFKLCQKLNKNNRNTVYKGQICPVLLDRFDLLE